MNPNRCDTAILLFSRSAAAESVAKPLISNKQGSAYSIAYQLIRHARQVARESGMKVFHVSEKRQHGATFGERFANAFEELFAAGYERVISIGNDCPGLKKQDLISAAEHLDEVSAVFGPAADGGAYLIAIHRCAFDRAAFLQIRWQTPQVFEALVSTFPGTCFCLEKKQDLDSPRELRRVLTSNALPILLKTRLLHCLASFLPDVFCQENVALHSCYLEHHYLRGPPRLLQSYML